MCSTSGWNNQFVNQFAQHHLLHSYPNPYSYSLVSSPTFVTTIPSNGCTNHQQMNTSTMSCANNWSHNVPQRINWATSTGAASAPSPDNTNRFVFTANPSSSLVSPPDPCTSQTATQWELLHKLSSNSVSQNAHNHFLKRRNSSDEDDDFSQPPTKQYISEERFAHKFDKLRISNSNSPQESDDSNDACERFEECVFEESESTTGGAAEGNSKGHVINITIPDETKAVMASSSRDDVMDRIIKSELSKCTKAVVLWRPPPVPKIIESAAGDNAIKVSEDKEEIKPDWNVETDVRHKPMILEDSAANDTEAMEM